MSHYSSKTYGYAEALSSRDVRTDKITLPLPPEGAKSMTFEMEIYARFMSHLRQVPNSRMEIKILSALQFTADMLDCSDALVSKTLVDLGLRAPRKAFPVSFLDFADKSLARRAWDVGSTAASIVMLKDHWDRIGEDRFSSNIRERYAVYGEGMFSTV